jgi:putative FmdB family regulatory protein
MPIYEYRCHQCSKVFELLIRATSGAGDTDQQCPECGSAELKRLFSLFAARSDRPVKAGAGGGGGGCCGGGCGCH